MQEKAKLSIAHMIEPMLTGITGALLGLGTMWLVLAVVPFFSDVRGNFIRIIIALVGVAVSGSNGVVLQSTSLC